MLFQIVEQEKRSFLQAERSGGSLQTLEHALDVLGVFAEKEELGVSELARRLGLHKSGIHRIVRTLASRGFVEQRPNRRYSLGVRVLELGNVYRLRLDLIRTAEPVLRQLSRQVNTNTHLARLEHGEVLDLLRVEYPAPLRVARSPILRRPAHCTALGKALLAYASPEKLNSVIEAGLPKLTRNTITQPDRLLKELERVRERGYAVDNQEFYPGIRCIAAPVFNENSEAVAAVSISGLITLVTEDRVPGFAALVMQAAREISVQLGWPRTAGA